MTRQEAIRYLQSSGMSEEQIRAVVEALTEPNIVYCGDCKHYREPSCYLHIERIWELKKTDYCSQGERE